MRFWVAWLAIVLLGCGSVAPKEASFSQWIELVGLDAVDKPNHIAVGKMPHTITRKGETHDIDFFTVERLIGQGKFRYATWADNSWHWHEETNGEVVRGCEIWAGGYWVAVYIPDQETECFYLYGEFQ